MPVDPTRRECPHCKRSLENWSSRLTNCPFCRLPQHSQVASAGEAPPSNYMARSAVEDVKPPSRRYGGRDWRWVPGEGA